LFAAVGDGIRQGSVPDPKGAAPQPVSKDFDRIREEFDFGGGDPALLRCVLLWATMVGAISLEVFGQYGPDTLSMPAAVFDAQMRLMLQALTAPAGGPWPLTGHN